MQRGRRTLALLSLSALAGTIIQAPQAWAAGPFPMLLEGRQLRLSPAPMLVEETTLIPVRSFAEALGATVSWDGSTRSILLQRGEKSVSLRVGRRLACLDRSCASAMMLERPVNIVNGSAFASLRPIAGALGVQITWDGSTRSIGLNPQGPSVIPTSPLQIATLSPGQVITGSTPLRAEGRQGTAVQFYLVDPMTGSGPIIAVGSDPAATYTYTPDPSVTGRRLVVAAVFDSTGKATYSHPVSVQLQPEPTVAITGVEPGGTVTGPISLRGTPNFAAMQVKWFLGNGSGSEQELATTGPDDSFTWYPQIGHNGARSIVARGYDKNGTAYNSAVIPFTVASDYRTVLSGIKDGDVLKGSVNLSVSANYSVESVQYLLNGNHMGWGFQQYWSITPETNGQYTLQVNVTDTNGTVRTLGPYKVTVQAKPQIWLTGVGPNQVVTDPVTLKVGSNVPLKSIDYYMTDEETGASQLLARKEPGSSFTYTFLTAGRRSIQAVAVDQNGEKLYSGVVKFRVYRGQLFSARPVASKTEFKELASNFAVQSYQKTGMSAALQVAQAILETGWGQSVPVDKYSGQLSNNLFGIKGTGAAGSVTSNTWEEYNGVAYRIDASFRAYHSLQESWLDHKDLLLTRSWYAPFRAVMSDPVLGAWGLRKSGYATDSQYPIKLINIMKQQDLFKLDQVEL